MFIDTIYNDPDFLEHHGIKGMRWGVRRYQNYDGSLKSAGKAHLATNAGQMKKQREDKRKQKALEKEWKEWSKGGWTKDYNEASQRFNIKLEEINNKYDSEADDFQKRTGLNGDAKYVEDWVANTTKEGFDYLHEIDDAWRTEYTNAIKKNHKNSELIDKYMENALFMNQYSELIEIAELSQLEKEDSRR